MLNLGGLFFTLDADTKGLQEAQRRIQSFADSVTQAFRSGADSAKDFIAAENAILASVNRVQALQNRIKGSLLPDGSQIALLEQLGQAYNKFTRNITSSEVGSPDFNRTKAKLTNDLGNITNILSSSEKEIRAASRQIAKDLELASEEKSNNNQARFTRFMGIDREAKSAKASAQTFQEAFKTIDAAASELAKTNQARFTAFMGIDREAKNAKFSAAIFQDAFKEIESAQRAAATQAAATARIQQAAGNSLFSVGERIKSINFKATNLAEIVPPKAKAELQELLVQLQRVQSTLKNNVTGSGVDLLGIKQATQNATSSINAISRQVNQIGTAFRASSSSTDMFRKVLQGLGDASLVVQGHLGGLSTRFFAFNQILRENGFVVAVTASTIAGLAAGVSLLATTAVGAGQQIQAIEAALTAVTRSAAATSAELGFVRDVSLKVGVDFQTAASQYTKFSASAKAAGLSVRDVQYSFQGLSAISATLHLSTDQLNSTFVALEQMLSKGKVQSEELRRQLGNQFPGAFAIAAKAIGVTTAQLDDMLRKGEVIAADFVPKFVAAAMQFYNVDLSKPADTLTTSLSKASSQVFLTTVALDRATGASALFKQGVDAVTGVLASIEQNLPNIIGSLGALVGAVTAVGAVWAAWVSIPVIIGTVTTTVSLLTTAIIELRTGVTTLGTVVTLFSNVPIVRLLSMLGLAAVAIGGAVYGFNALKKAANDNQAAFRDTASIEQYIKMQKELGFQVASTTAELIKQQRVQTVQSVQAVKDAASEFRKAGKNTLMDSLTSGAAIASGMDPKDVSTLMAGVRKERQQATFKELQEAYKTAKKNSDLLRELNEISKKPEQMSNPVVPLTDGDGDKGKGRRDSVDRVLDDILRMKAAVQELQAVLKGNKNYDLIGDFYKAQAAVNQMSDVQVNKLAEAFGLVGANLKDKVIDSLADVYTKTRQAEEATKMYVAALNDIQKGTANIQNLNRQLAYLMGGGSTAGLQQFESLGKALEKLKASEPANGFKDDALRAIIQRYSEMNGEIEDTPPLLMQAAQAMADFEVRQNGLANLVKGWSDYNNGIRATKEALAQARLETIAYAKNSPFAAWIGEETAAAVKRGLVVKQWVEQQKEAARAARGVLTQEDLDDIQQYGEAWLEVLRQQDEWTRSQARVQAAAEATREVFRTTVSTGVNNFKDLLKGVKSLSDALLDLANNVLDALWKRFVEMPLLNMLDSVGQSEAQNVTSGVDSLIAGTSVDAIANDNSPDSGVKALSTAASQAAGALGGNFTQSVAESVVQIVAGKTANLSLNASLLSLTAAANAATNALLTMAGSSGGSGGGLFDSILGGLGGLFGGFDFGGAQGVIDAASGIDLGKSIGGDDFSSFITAGRAFGGVMNAGQLYRINEPGVGGEYFIPSVNGYMSPKPPANDSGGTHINVVTNIDARGATLDTIAELRLQMAQRDAQLRAELPTMIDSRVVDSSLRSRYRGA